MILAFKYNINPIRSVNHL